jgi:hypothetical protein
MPSTIKPSVSWKQELHWDCFYINGLQNEHSLEFMAKASLHPNYLRKWAKRHRTKGGKGKREKASKSALSCHWGKLDPTLPGWDGPIASGPFSCLSCSLFYFLLSYYCCTRGTLWYLRKCLQYIIVEFIPSSILLYPSSPIPGIVSAGLIFPFTHMSM